MSLVSTFAYAGPKFEITPMVGKKIYNYSDDAAHFDDGEALIGLRANAYVTDRVSVQLGGEASKNNRMSDGGETDLERGMVNVQYDIPARGRVTPFVMAGGGYEKLHRTTPDNVDSQAFYNAGAGLRYSINKKIDVVAEARAIHKVEDKDDDIIGSIGVGFKYGSRGGECKAQGISVKALSMKELAALTPKKVEEDIKPVEAAKEVVEAEVIDRKFVYDTDYVNMCDGSISNGVANSGSGSDNSNDSGNMTVSDGYYVQVIALRKNSPDVMISRLDKKGYSHALKQEGSLTRILVGPYASRAAASKALRSLKRIKKDAFIYHAK